MTQEPTAGPGGVSGPPNRPRTRLLAILLAAAPNLVVLGHIWWPGTRYFVWTGTDIAALPFTLYARTELTIVPTSLALTLVTALIPRSRPLALWLLLGTLSGATLVLLALTQRALAWT